MMINDPNFILLISFVLFVGGGVVLLRAKLRCYLNNRIDRISKELNDAACEKDKALLQFTQVNRTAGKLPQEIAKVWEEQVVDFTGLHARLEQELKEVEKKQAMQLARVQDLVLQREVAQILQKTAFQFASDLQHATPEKQASLVELSLSLLDAPVELVR